MESINILLPDSFGGTPKQIAQSYLREHIGQNLFITDELNKKRGEIEFVIGAYRPIMLNYTKKGRLIRNMKFDDIFRMFLVGRKSNTKILYPTRDEIELRINEKFQNERSKIGQLLLQHSNKNFVEIPQINSCLNPISEILVNLLRSEEGYLELGTIKKKRRGRTKIYLELLERLGAIRLEKDRVMEGNTLLALREKSNAAENEFNTEAICNEVLGLAIKDELYYISERMGVRSIKPFINYANVFYMDSIVYGNSFEIKDEGLMKRLKYYYGRRPSEMTFENRVEKLVNAEIFRRDGEYLTENPDIGNAIRSEYQ